MPALTDRQSVAALRPYPPDLEREWARMAVSVLPNQLEVVITRDWSPDGVCAPFLRGRVGSPNWLRTQLGGSWAGNAPLNRFASFWFSFREVGVLVGSLLWGVATQMLDRRFFGRTRKDPVGIVTWQTASISIATAPTPGHLLLTGFAAARSCSQRTRTAGGAA